MNLLLRQLMEPKIVSPFAGTAIHMKSTLLRQLMESAPSLHEIHLVQTAYRALASFSIRRERRPHESTLLRQPVEYRLCPYGIRLAQTARGVQASFSYEIRLA
jgi:hypothetical protein